MITDVIKINSGILTKVSIPSVSEQIKTIESKTKKQNNAFEIDLYRNINLLTHDCIKQKWLEKERKFILQMITDRLWRVEDIAEHLSIALDTATAKISSTKEKLTQQHKRLNNYIIAQSTLIVEASSE
tara:strand:- start:67 stop:450 length:384 start_codon:yes stop_codon:yes gene_type:complete